MKRILLVSLLGSSALIAPCAQARFGLTITPIIGYERVQKVLPEAHIKNRMVYGARATLGVPLLALEGQYTRGDDSESFPALSTTSRDITDKAKVGLRAGFGGSIVRLIARGGVQAKQNHYIEKVNGIETTNTIQPITYKPYAGAGLDIRLSSKISFTADATAIFNKWPDMKQNDYETTAGLNVRFP
jgi:hypothetical protein